MDGCLLRQICSSQPRLAGSDSFRCFCLHCPNDSICHPAIEGIAWNELIAWNGLVDDWCECWQDVMLLVYGAALHVLITCAASKCFFVFVHLGARAASVSAFLSPTPLRVCDAAVLNFCTTTSNFNTTASLLHFRFLCLDGL